jgi:hypothetical protein
MADVLTNGNIAGFDLNRTWIDESDNTVTNNLGLGSSFTIPPTAGSFIISNDTGAFDFSGIAVDPDLHINNKSVSEILSSLSFLMKFIIEKYDLHECKELKELAELDNWSEKVEVEKIPEFIKDEDFKL